MLVKIRAIIMTRTWTLNNIKNAIGMERTWTLNNIKSAIVKRYQIQTRTWIRHNAMRTIDNIVMNYLHIELDMDHWKNHW